MSERATHDFPPGGHAPGAGQPLVQVSGLHVEYRTRSGAFEALHDIGFQLRAGEVLGVVGESGCGKSTLAAAMMGLLPPNGRVASGEIQVAGEDLLALDPAHLRRLRGERVSIIFQDPLTSLNPTFPIATQMVNAQRAHDLGDGDRDRRQRAVEMLERVGIPDPDDRVDSYPHQFSGGMRQRIMIATALLLGPKLLIADEATSALDVTLQAQILALLRRLCREQGTAIMLISHDLGVISELSERVVVLYAGRVAEAGELDEILSRPKHPYTRKLIAAVPSRHRRDERLATIRGRVPSLAALPPGCTFANRCDYAQPVCEEGEPHVFQADGHGARCLIYSPPDSGYDKAAAEDVARREAADSVAPPLPQPTDEVLLSMQGLQVHFGAEAGFLARFTGRSPAPVRAVDGIDVEFRRGEAVGLVGESGSGKTTLGKALLGLAPLTGGRVAFDSQALDELDRAGWRQLRQRIQMIFQEPSGSLSPRTNVGKLLTEPYRINDVPKEDRYSVDELLAMVGLSSEQATKYPHQLSGGQARRVGIARALAVKPEFIVADEPTSGLDVSAAASVLNLLQDLRREFDLTYLVITHDLNLVGYVTDRVAVMYLGKVVEIGTADQLFDRPRHPYTQALLASIPDPVAERIADVTARVAGEIPSPQNPPSGCRFRTRCPYAEDRCAEDVPLLYDVGDGQRAACHFWEEIAADQKARTGPHES